MAGLTSGGEHPGFGGRAGGMGDARHGSITYRAYLAATAKSPFAEPVWHYLTLHQPDKTRTGQQRGGRYAELGDKLGRSVNQLSGGEWQRVRLAAVVLQIHPRR